MSDQTIYNATAQTDGPLALAHQRIIRFKRSGVFVNITGDVNNLALNPTKVTVPRENYGNKGLPGEQIIGYSFAPSFTVEAVRDSSTKAIAQAWLVDLLTRAFASGSDNQGEFQIFDGLDENLPAFEGTFSISVADNSTNYSDKAVYAFTLQSDGVVDQITSPIAGDGKPIIESVGPAAQAVGDQLVIRGYKMTGTTGITIDSQSVTEFVIVDDYTIVAVIPASVTGEAAIVVTNAAGASESFDYTAATA